MTTNRWVRRFAAIVVTGAASVALVATPVAAATEATRLSGSTRIGTAVAIAQRSFPGGAPTAYLARADVVADALAAGSLPDGPVLVVPSCDGVPGEVAAELDRLGPDEVVALGGTGAVCDATLASAGTGRSTSRLAGADRMATAAAVAARAFPEGAATVYIASATSAADAVAAGSLTDGPVLLVPATGSVPASVRGAVDGLDPSRVIALGGTGAVSDAVLVAVADGRSTARLAGNGRVETAVAIAQRAFPDGSPAAYIARADVFADAIAAGSLVDGPVLLHASCGALAPAVADELARLRPSEVVALGGTGAVCQDVLAAATAVVDAAQPADCVYAEPGESCPTDIELEVVTDLPEGDAELAAIEAGIRAGAAQGLRGPSVTLLAMDDRDALAEAYAARSDVPAEEVREWLETSEAFADHRGIIVFNVSLPRARRGTNLQFLFKTAVHEWFHVYQSSLSDRSPTDDRWVWLVEGAAEWFAWDVADRNGREEIATFLRDAGERYGAPRFAEQDRSLADLESGEGFHGFGSSYELTPHAIDHLISRTSVDAVLRDIWPALNGEPMGTAFEEVFGMTGTAFYETADPYLRSLRAEGDAPVFPS